MNEWDTKIQQIANVNKIIGKVAHHRVPVKNNWNAIKKEVYKKPISKPTMNYKKGT